MAKRDLQQDALRQLLRRRGPLSGSEIMKALGLTQPTFSRVASGLSDLLVIGEGKSRFYALARSTENHPIVKIDEKGEACALGELRLVEPKGAAFLPTNQLKFKARVFEDIPYFIWDLRPQGYLGKLFVGQHADLKLPERWEDWSESDLYRTLKFRGDDLAGNLIVGRESFERFQLKALKTISHSQREKRYPKLAAETQQNIFVGSSAGGEQPKFTAKLRSGSEVRHAIVKFSPPTKTEAGRRWADLLYAEEVALNTLRESGYAAALAEAFESEGQVFLDVTRFDRVGQNGRRGVLSLGAIDDEYAGARRSWTLTARDLFGQGLIKKQDSDNIAFLDCFGAHIANSDRHFGNLSLYWELDAKRFSLAPVYDMLPMAYAPIQGSVINREFKKPVAQFEQIGVWKSAEALATEYWRRLSRDKRLSAGFRAIAGANMKALG